MLGNLCSHLFVGILHRNMQGTERKLYWNFFAFDTSSPNCVIDFFFHSDCTNTHGFDKVNLVPKRFFCCFKTVLLLKKKNQLSFKNSIIFHLCSTITLPFILPLSSPAGITWIFWNSISKFFYFDFFLECCEKLCFWTVQWTNTPHVWPGHAWKKMLYLQIFHVWTMNMNMNNVVPSVVWA